MPHSNTGGASACSGVGSRAGTVWAEGPDGRGLRQGKSHRTRLGHSAGSGSGIRLFGAHGAPGATAIRGGRFSRFGPARRLSPRPLEALPAERTGLIHRLKAKGRSNREIARGLGVSEMAIRKVLHRLGWKEPGGHHQQELLSLEEPDGSANPNLSGSASAGDLEPGRIPGEGANPNLSAFCSQAKATAPTSHDTDPSDRGADRLLARLGLLEDAAPLFGSAIAVPRAGVLLAVPVLVVSGVFECAQKIYGSLGPAFYGLRTSLLTLLLMALWRIKRPEGLKEHSPQDLGRVLGLDRAPEVKTLRRKLAQLAAAGRAAQFGQALAQQRVALRGEALGFLYTDGHVRVYHGQHTLPKAHVARMRISLPATSDYWVNDSRGDPLFVVTAEANAGLVKMLPGILAQVRALVGKRRLTVVFDRGGFSPKLFLQILDRLRSVDLSQGALPPHPPKALPALPHPA